MISALEDEDAFFAFADCRDFWVDDARDFGAMIRLFKGSSTDQ
jgi:hypothetical protein